MRRLNNKLRFKNPKYSDVETPFLNPESKVKVKEFYSCPVSGNDLWENVQALWQGLYREKIKSNQHNHFSDRSTNLEEK